MRKKQDPRTILPGSTGYVDENAVAYVSFTDSKTNFFIMIMDGSLESLLIRPGELPEEDTATPETEETTEPATQPTTSNDNYLSKPEDTDDTVYTDGKDKYLTDSIPESNPKPLPLWRKLLAGMSLSPQCWCRSSVWCLSFWCLKAANPRQGNW